jgi:hypothetical protein
MAKPRSVTEEDLQGMVRRFDLVDGKIYYKETYAPNAMKGMEAGTVQVECLKYTELSTTFTMAYGRGIYKLIT